jgi:hypothetical protein
LVHEPGNYCVESLLKVDWSGCSKRFKCFIPNCQYLLFLPQVPPLLVQLVNRYRSIENSPSV